MARRPAFWSFLSRLKAAVPRWPGVKQLGVTGEARYSARTTQRHERELPSMAVRYDNVSFEDYDKARLYPIVADCLKSITLVLGRADFHFECADQTLADLAAQEIGPKICDLVVNMARGGMSFGYHACEKVWAPKWDVTLTSSQSNATSTVAARFPFVWTIDKFGHFDPSDTMLLIHPRTRRFWGLRQFIYAQARDIPKVRLMHWAHDSEYDSIYGMARTKPIVPFVQVALSIWDDIAIHSRSFAEPIKRAWYRPGGTTVGGAVQDNADMCINQIAQLESGASFVHPAEFDDPSGNPLWGLELLQVGGENDEYVAKIQTLHDTIRAGLAFPEMAGSQTPDSGTYNLGETQIDLYLANIEHYLRTFAAIISEQLLTDFAQYNFGSQAPPLTIVFDPVDIKVQHALLRNLLDMLAAGEVEDASGQEYMVDYAKIASDSGLKLVPVDARDRLRRAIEARIASPAPASAQQGAAQDALPPGPKDPLDEPTR